MTVDFITIDRNGKTVTCTPTRWLTSRTPNRASEHKLSNPPNGPVSWLLLVARDLASVMLGCAKEDLTIVLAPGAVKVEPVKPIRKAGKK